MSESKKLKPGSVVGARPNAEGNQRPDREGIVPGDVIKSSRGSVINQKSNNDGRVRSKRSDAGRPHSDRRPKNPVAKKSEKISFDSQDSVAEEIAALRERK